MKKALGFLSSLEGGQWMLVIVCAAAALGGGYMASQLGGVLGAFGRGPAFPAIVGTFSALVAWSFMSSQKKTRSKKEHGSARWAGRKEAARYMDPDPENNIPLTKTESATLNPRPENPEYARNRHTLVMGASGSGKTRFFLKPGLMHCRSTDYPTAFVVTDPKGTILEECGKMLVECGYEISFLNTINFSKSLRYNPFEYIKSEDDIMIFVEVFMSSTDTKKDGGGDDFWRC